ncbi:uncharacterized protein SRS1_16452 [Sporisorium reilianum f. sp. reilianum]|uniref:SURP motif domain-containing protein n=1 Tax=Sporisorium reilianum f. sp. reilianum TaxID=72559 RepID=A0A2N8UM92_9BASI|nr:uncharacterized protein SRS1_16452 [Sporisorium reilianum f. sp. reilianum]
MSRPPSKRRRFHTQPSTDDTSSTAHIFAPASTSHSTSIPHPTSYEITLNHNSELKRSLLPPSFSPSPKESEEYGTRLVTWTSECGTQSITTDRYDAVHLLSHIPTKPCPTDDDADAAGWSGLDSDTEDLFYMTSLEAATFAHQKAKTTLDAQRSVRLATLPSPSPPPPPSTKVAAVLSKAQFDLMQRTARAVASSSNASLLELKILANHGADARFAFLRNDAGMQPKWSAVWEALKTSKGEMGYDAALNMCDDRGVKPSSSAGGALVAYDDSDSDSQSDPQPEPKAASTESPPTTAATQPPTTPDDASLKKKQKQAERLARAKQWLLTRASHSTSPPTP